MGTDYQDLYKRFLKYKARAEIAEQMNKGGVYMVEDEDDNNPTNQSLRDIQMNTKLTLEQRRIRVEAEVGQLLILGDQIHDREQEGRAEQSHQCDVWHPRSGFRHWEGS